MKKTSTSDYGRASVLIPAEPAVSGTSLGGFTKNRQSLNNDLGQIRSDISNKCYKAFEEFYGLEEAIEQIVSFFRPAAQGVEEKKQNFYLLGPLGGGLSSFAELPNYWHQKCDMEKRA